MMFGLFKSPVLSPRLLRLKESALFATLTPLELNIVDGLMHERRYLADEIVFDEARKARPCTW
jgi:CRP/FNR family cyclic AMP-dependent transcriptional regulator